VKLPNWDCGNARDQQAMIRWVNTELDEAEFQDLSTIFPGNLRQLKPDERLAYQIKRADRGDLGPLRRAFPQIARFINYPKRKRATRRRYDPVGGAVADVRRIRSFWRQHYGRFMRAKTDPITAEQIAADRWDVDIDTLLNRLKKTKAS
jgi:hypothetical protein